ncbi:hypothetical protein [Streptomyces sp. NPDC056987]|uniref:hypothetical protein n=1 Tax=Streptomyces sp. NPDC056987 TaxID=3345988 RepID=UPI0036420CAF
MAARGVVCAKNDRRTRVLRTFCQIYWLELLRHAGVEEDRLTQEQFVTADRLTDGDGVISRQEFVRAVREHFLSNDPEAPGSLLRCHRVGPSLAAVETDRPGRSS